MFAIKNRLFLILAAALFIVMVPNHMACPMSADYYADDKPDDEHIVIMMGWMMSLEEDDTDDGNASVQSIEDAEAALAALSIEDAWDKHDENKDEQDEEDEEEVDEDNVYEGSVEEYLEEVENEQLAEALRWEKDRRWELEYSEQIAGDLRRHLEKEARERYKKRLAESHRWEKEYFEQKARENQR